MIMEVLANVREVQDERNTVACKVDAGPMPERSRMCGER